jgi:mannonate dehydratase
VIRLKKTWRWFGVNDPVTLDDLRQMEIEGLVTALYDVPPGETWQAEQIRDLNSAIMEKGMHWSVVESLPVPEGIKQHNANYQKLVENYRTSLKNLGENGIKTVCYNFMPAIDWVRTDIGHRLPNGTEVMYFERLKFIVFDLFILDRPGAAGDYPSEEQEQARQLFKTMSDAEAEELAFNIIVLTQAFIHGEAYGESYKQAFLKRLDAYRNIDSVQLRENLVTFLHDVIPVAEDYGINLCIHPDDPPFPVLGLPRVVSTFDDLEMLFREIPSVNNGLTFCSGSLSIRKDNDLAKIAETFARRIHFAHLRNNIVFNNGDFRESGHLEGDADLPGLILILAKEMQRRHDEGRADFRIPMRPDHGIKMLDDFKRDSPPGYPLIGRYRGLLEISGIEAGLEAMMRKYGTQI